MVLSMDRWAGNVAIVTGVSSGIGVAIAEQLVKHGVKVVGVARRVEKVEENAKKWSGKKGKLYPFKADITKEEDILKAFKWTADNLGPVSILINNAGVVIHGSSLSEGKTEDFKTVLDLNVLGLSIATREAVKVMQTNNINGHIIHINSCTGHYVVNFPGLGIYPASKFAVRALTETLRQELARNGSKIKISEVSPGGVRSEMTSENKSLTPEAREVISKAPLLDPEDIADGVTYALSTPEHVQVHEIMIRPIGEQF